MEFEWKIFPGFTTAAILEEILKKMGESQCDPADFKDIEWEARANEE